MRSAECSPSNPMRQRENSFSCMLGFRLSGFGKMKPIDDRLEMPPCTFFMQVSCRMQHKSVCRNSNLLGGGLGHLPSAVIFLTYKLHYNCKL